MTLANPLSLVDSSQLADTGSLAALKQAAGQNSPQALRAAAKQFESLFLGMVLKSMRQANFKDPLFGSDQGNLYQDMYDDQIAAQISKGKGLGLADMLVQQLRRAGAGKGADASSASKSAGGTTPNASPGSSGSSGASGAPGSATGAATTGSAATAPSTPDSSPSACATSAQQASFARALWPDAQQAARQLGVSPVTLLAQAALETNWGRSVPQGTGGATSHNLFGIKATAWNGPAVESSTQEYSGGGASTVTAQFRAYGSTSQCFQDYVSLLQRNPRYAAALGTGNDVQAFGSALQQGGYATDPAYASKLTAVAGTLARALAPPRAGAIGQASPVGAPVASGSLKLAANVPIASGSGTLPRR